ncbi:MAG: DbpA RNA binding domain-containing protein [Bacteroidetes bacterium]|nr:DbpA RNA binding domain-containing protein [Bacteroidota bacterium]
MRKCWQKDQLKYDEVRELIFKNTKVSGRAVRDIEMKGVYSFFMTDRDSADQMCQVTSATFNGRPFRIDEASKQKEGRSEFKEGRSEFKEGKSEFKSNKRRRN